MTPEHFNRSAQHWQRLLKQKRPEPKVQANLMRVEEGESRPAEPTTTPTPRTIVRIMQSKVTKTLISTIIAAYAIPVYALLILVDATSQIHNLDSFMMHTPVILIGFGYLGSIQLAWQRGNIPLLLWFSAVLWMVGMWT